MPSNNINDVIGMLSRLITARIENLTRINDKLNVITSHEIKDQYCLVRLNNSVCNILGIPVMQYKEEKEYCIINRSQSANINESEYLNNVKLLSMILLGIILAYETLLSKFRDLDNARLASDQTRLSLKENYLKKVIQALKSLLETFTKQCTNLREKILSNQSYVNKTTFLTTYNDYPDVQALWDFVESFNSDSSLFFNEENHLKILHSVFEQYIYNKDQQALELQRAFLGPPPTNIKDLSQHGTYVNLVKRLKEYHEKVAHFANQLPRLAKTLSSRAEYENLKATIKSLQTNLGNQLYLLERMKGHKDVEINNVLIKFLEITNATAPIIEQVNVIKNKIDGLYAVVQPGSSLEGKNTSDLKNAPSPPPLQTVVNKEENEEEIKHEANKAAVISATNRALSQERKEKKLSSAMTVARQNSEFEKEIYNLEQVNVVPLPVASKYFELSANNYRLLLDIFEAVNNNKIDRVFTYQQFEDLARNCGAQIFKGGGSVRKIRFPTFDLDTEEEHHCNAVMHVPHNRDRKNGELFGCTVRDFHAVLVRAGITPSTCTCKSASKASGPPKKPNY